MFLCSKKDLPCDLSVFLEIHSLIVSLAKDSSFFIIREHFRSYNDASVYTPIHVLGFLHITD